MKNNIKKIRLITFTIIMFCIVGMVFSPVFETNDDVSMRDIISGNYVGKPDGHAVYIMYPLAKMISILYIYLPKVPWYGVFTGLCIAMCTYVIIYEINNIDYKSKIIKNGIKVFSVLCSCIICLNSFIVQQFTITAGVLAGTAIFLILIKKRKILAAVMLILSCLIRKEVFILSCPFVMAAIIWNIVSNNTNREKLYSSVFKKVIITGVGLTLILCMLSGINNYIYSSQSWENYSQYNATRGRLYDYTDILYNDEYRDECLKKGISQLEYNMIKNYYLSFDNRITEAKLHEVNEIVKKEQINCPLT